MNALRLVMVTTILASFALVTPASADWYVVQDKLGQSAVIDQIPGYGWSITFGPFATKDAAQREMGTGTGRLPDGMAGLPAPAVTRAAEPGLEFLESEEFVVFESPEAAPVRRTARATEPGAVSRDFGVAATAGKEKITGEMAEYGFFELKGQSARNSAGQDLGRFDHLVVAKDGRVSYVIFSRQGKFVPVPWDAVHFGGERGALIVDVEKDKLASAPAFDRKDFYNDMSKPAFHDKVTGFYQGSAARTEGRAMKEPAGKSQEMSKQGAAASKETPAMEQRSGAASREGAAVGKSATKESEMKKSHETAAKKEGAGSEKSVGKATEMDQRSGTASKEMPEKKMRTDVPVEAPQGSQMDK